MKRLRNISIYYIIFGVLCALSFVAFKLWRILIPGVILLVVFIILRFIFRRKKLPPKLTKDQSLYVSVFLYALPILFTIWVYWYTERPFRQTIIIPENYEGVVAIQYGQEDGQRQWTGGFLGIGASRLIKVDTFGISFTQFKFHDNDIKLLDIYSPNSSNGLEIYFKNDLKHTIPINVEDQYDKPEFEISKKENRPIAYLTALYSPPLIIFVVTKPSNYHKYFMTLEEKKKEQLKNPNIYYSSFYFDDNKNILKEKYDYLYKLNSEMNK
ncbi:MAG: hypothetical protein L3J20_03740 [Flavobacteriaceae bacterium]|nr:hypothetical protein [Flavobacteriaceae bacterium]